MKHAFLKSILVFSLFFMGVISASAQKNDSGAGGKTTLEIPPNIEVKKHDFKDPRNEKEVGDNQKAEVLNDKIQKLVDEQNRKNAQSDGILTPEQLHQKTVQKQQGEIHKKYKKVDQYLGGFSSTSSKIYILCKDFQYPDGDRVTIYVNDEPVIIDITLESRVLQFALPLKKGLNVISFKALNQGSSGPNTAAFAIYDEDANEISSNAWNLATGAKATLSIARVDKE